jgi:hypothetical protein
MTDTTWIVLIKNHLASIEALPFSSEERAIKAARARAPVDAEGIAGEELTDSMRKDGWVFFLPYGSEGDCVRVVRRTLDGD